MAIFITAGQRGQGGEGRGGVVVPPAAVWGGGRAQIFQSNPVHVRTLRNSNRADYHGSEHCHPAPGLPSNTPLRSMGETPCVSVTSQTDSTLSRSISDNLKQWAGGAFFGLVIVAGILLSQAGQEESLPTYSETQMVGLDTDPHSLGGQR